MGTKFRCAFSRKHWDTWLARLNESKDSKLEQTKHLRAGIEVFRQRLAEREPK